MKSRTPPDSCKERTIKVDTDDWMAALEACRVQQEDIVPKGYFTVAQWAENWELGNAQTGKTIRKSIHLFDAKQFRIKCGTKMLYPVWHYKFKRKP